MSYIGNPVLYQAFVTDQFSGNGGTTFTMSVAPANTASVLVSITGVLQDPSTYSVNGTTLTFSAAPPTGTGNISVRYLGIPASGITNTAYRTVTEFTASSAQTSFTVPSYTVGFINVFRNGVRLGSADFTATNGTTVVLANGATSGDLVTTESFYVSSVLNAIQQYNGSSTNQTLTTPTLTTPTMSTATLTGTSTFAGGVANAYGFGVGTAVPSSGAGIAFPATQSASSDANTLDDYEEGTFTPTLTASGYTFTFTSQTGVYTKVGNLVTFKCYFTAQFSSGSGTVAGYIAGLPFTSSSSYANFGGCSFYPDGGSTFFTRTGVIRTNPSSTTMSIGDGWGGSGTTVQKNWATLPAGTEWELSGHYYI